MNPKVQSAPELAGAALGKLVAKRWAILRAALVPFALMAGVTLIVGQAEPEGTVFAAGVAAVLLISVIFACQAYRVLLGEFSSGLRAFSVVPSKSWLFFLLWSGLFSAVCLGIVFILAFVIVIVNNSADVEGRGAVTGLLVLGCVLTAVAFPKLLFAFPATALGRRISGPSRQWRRASMRVCLVLVPLSLPAALALLAIPDFSDPGWTVAHAFLEPAISLVCIAVVAAVIAVAYTSVRENGEPTQPGLIDRYLQSLDREQRNAMMSRSVFGDGGVVRPPGFRRAFRLDEDDFARFEEIRRNDFKRGRKWTVTMFLAILVAIIAAQALPSAYVLGSVFLFAAIATPFSIRSSRRRFRTSFPNAEPVSGDAFKGRHTMSLMLNPKLSMRWTGLWFALCLSLVMGSMAGLHDPDERIAALSGTALFSLFALGTGYLFYKHVAFRRRHGRSPNQSDLDQLTDAS